MRVHKGSIALALQQVEVGPFLQRVGALGRDGRAAERIQPHRPIHARQRRRGDRRTSQATAARQDPNRQQESKRRNTAASAVPCMARANHIRAKLKRATGLLCNSPAADRFTIAGRETKRRQSIAVGRSHNNTASPAKLAEKFADDARCIHSQLEQSFASAACR